MILARVEADSHAHTVVVAIVVVFPDLALVIAKVDSVVSVVAAVVVPPVIRVAAKRVSLGRDVVNHRSPPMGVVTVVDARGVNRDVVTQMRHSVTQMRHLVCHDAAELIFESVGEVVPRQRVRGDEQRPHGNGDCRRGQAAPRPPGLPRLLIS